VYLSYPSLEPIQESHNSLLQKPVAFFVFDKYIDDSVKQFFKGYQDMNLFTTEMKFRKYFKPLHFLSIRFLKDKKVTQILIKLKEIYDNGGLEKYTIEYLDDLGIAIHSYADGFSYKQTEIEQKERA
jgi:hypothetical protein